MFLSELIAFAFVPVVTITSLAAPQTLAEDDPRTAVEGYLQYNALGKAALIRKFFAPGAMIQFVDGGELKLWTTEGFASKFQQPAPDEYRRVRRVDRLDMNGTAASAAVTWIIRTCCLRIICRC